MVKAFLSFLYREIHSLHRAAYLLAVFAFGSQVLALVRDRLLASAFGANETLDLYYAAFRIPDFVFVVVASFVSVSVLVPFLAERLEHDSEKARHFVSSVFSFFGIAVLFVSSVVFFLLPMLVGLVFPGFSGAEAEELITLSRILLLSPVFLGVSSLLGSVTQIHKRFFIYAISPLFYNLSIIVGIVVLAPVWGISGVVLGVIAGAFLHMMIQVPFVVRSGLFPYLTRRIDWKTMRSIFLLSVPRTVTLGTNHLVILVLISIASFMSEGSIAVFSFSYNLQSVPLSIVGVSYSLAAFPTLSRLFIGGKTEEFVNQIVVAGRHIIFWSLPIAVLFIVLRAQIVRVILGSGEFTWADTRLTAAALALFSLSVVFQSLTLLFVRGYYSAGKTKKPLLFAVISGAVSLVVAVFLNYAISVSDFFRDFLESLLRVQDIAGTAVLVLPLAFSIGMIINALLLWRSFVHDFGSQASCLSRSFFHSLSAAVIGGAVAWFCLNVFDDIFNISTFGGIFFQGFLSGVTGTLSMIGMFLILENQEIRDVARTISRKIWKDTTVLGPDPDIV